jgi:hypothetical protein
MRDPPIDMELDKIADRGLQQALLAVLRALFFVAGFRHVTGQCAQGLKLPVITRKIGGLTRFK